MYKKILSAFLVVAFYVFSCSAQNKEVDNNGNTLLHVAALAGEVDFVKVVIEMGLNVNTKNKDGFTPLHFASLKGHKGVVELLIAKGADVNAKDNLGISPLRIVSLKDYRDVAELLILKGADVNERDSEGNPLLHQVALTGQIELAELLIAKGADINAKDADGKPLLHLAVLGGRIEVARFLIGKGVDVNAKNKDGRTLLHMVAIEGNIDMVRLLIDKGAAVSARDSLGNTPLFYAALGGQAEVAELLIEKKADVNAKNDSGGTPLHGAASRGYLNIAKLLVAKGADINAKANNGTTSLDLAKDDQMIQLLRSNSSQGASATGQKRGAPPKRVPRNNPTKDTAYRMSEYYLLLLRQKASLDEQAEPIDDSKRKEIRDWLSALNFQSLPEPQKSDLEECQRSMLYYVDQPTGTILSLDSATQWLAVLIDFQIDERSLKQAPDPKLADGIRLWLLASKASTLINLKVDTDQSDKINPLARFLVEYFAISFTFAAQRRPIKAQAALLAMDPSQIKDPKARADFAKLHGDLLELSRIVSVTRDATTKMKVVTFIVDRFSALRRKYQIPYNQIFRYCGPTLNRNFDDMRKSEQ